MRCCGLVPGGIRREISAGKAARILEQVTPSGPAAGARCELAAEVLAGLRRRDARLREASKKLAAVVRASGTSLTGRFGVGPVITGTVIGDVRQVFRFPGRDRFASGNGTAPVEVSSGDRKKACRLSPRGNRRVNHAIHMAAISQIRHQRGDGRAFYDKKVAPGKTHKEALRALKRRISDAIYAALVADTRHATACPQGPGGQPGNHPASRAAGSHPARRHFGQATPGPRHHTTAAAGIQGRAGHSPVAATLPPAEPQVQVERPQRSEDERPGGAARRRPYPAARKARSDPPARPLKPQLRTNPRTTA
jgi:transposase